MAKNQFVAGVRRVALDFIPAPLRAKCARYLRDRRGAVAIIYGLALPGLIGMVGLGVETGYWYTSKRNLQTEADAGALGAAWKKMYSGTNGDMEVAADNEAERNGFVDTAASDLVMNSPPVYGAFAGDAMAAEVIISRNHEPMFLGILDDDPMPISARSVAKLINVGDACVLALHTTQAGALTNTGSTTVNMPECVMASNSNSSTAIDITGSATVTVEQLWSHGGYQKGGSASVTTTNATVTNGLAIPDPYAGLSVAGKPTGCTNQNWNGTQTVQPPTSGGDAGKMKICNNAIINAGANIHFKPGTYWFDSADLKINGGTVDCPDCEPGGDGVTFIFTGNNGAQVGTIDINGNATVQLNAPGAGTYQGVLFFQDPIANTQNNKSFLLNGGANTSLVGAMYAPKNEIQWSGNNSLNSLCTLVIGLTVTFTGNSDLNVENCDDYGTNVPKIYKVDLVE